MTRPKTTLRLAVLALSLSLTAGAFAASIRGGGRGRPSGPSRGVPFRVPGSRGGIPILNPAVPGASNAPVPATVPLAQPGTTPGPVSPLPQERTVLPSETVRALGGHEEKVLEASSDPSGDSRREAVDGIYLGSRNGRKGPVSAGSFVVNDEGVSIFGRAAAYYAEVRRIVEKHKGTVDLSESLDVMDDSYADVWAKLAAIEAVAQRSRTQRHNTHLERTLTWVDAVMRDKGRTTAIHTHRVYFHPSDNPRSEIEEGIRRVDRTVDDAVNYFSKGGKAEKHLGKLDDIVLVFDARGYAEIKDHLRGRASEVSREHGKRFKVLFLDELAKVPRSAQEVRQGVNAMVRLYAAQKKGLEKIIEGVIYSRYVGLLLELKTVDHYLSLGYEILQSGRDLLDGQGKYVTELDTVVRAPDGKVSLVEAKSARVPLPFDAVLRDKFLYKLNTYKKSRALLEKGIGARFDEVVFSVDIGPNFGLKPFLTGQEESLSRKYGFPVRFLFLSSSPEGAF